MVVDHDELERPVTVAVIEDQPVTVEGIRSWISRDLAGRVELIADGPTIEEVLAGPGATADVLLLDLELHGRLVVDRVAELCADGRRVIVYSAHDDPAIILAVQDAGASAFLAKHESRAHCVETIVTVAADRPYVTPAMARAIISDERPHRPQLSEKERTALLLWFQSMSKESVARRMGISEATVRQYINRARVKYAKSGRPAPTKAALLARAIEDGLVRLEDLQEYRSYAAASPDTPL